MNMQKNAKSWTFVQAQDPIVNCLASIFHSVLFNPFSGFTPKNGARPNVHNVGILITDGLSNNGSATIRQANKAKKYGITMFCVGAQIPSMKEVNKIASKPTKSHVFRYKKFSQMRQGGPAIVKKICQQVNKLPPATPPPTTTTTTTTAMRKLFLHYLIRLYGDPPAQNRSKVALL
jgi:hypothetical protein